MGQRHRRELCAALVLAGNFLVVLGLAIAVGELSANSGVIALCATLVAAIGTVAWLVAIREGELARSRWAVAVAQSCFLVACGAAALMFDLQNLVLAALTAAAVTSLLAVLLYVGRPLWHRVPILRRLDAGALRAANAPQSGKRERPVVGSVTLRILEEATRRGYVSAALEQLQAYASDTPRIDAEGNASPRPPFERAQAAMRIAHILDRLGEAEEASAWVDTALEIDAGAFQRDSRGTARLVAHFSKRGEFAVAAAMVEGAESQLGRLPAARTLYLAAPPQVLPAAARVAHLSDVFRGAGLCGVELVDATAPATLSNLRGLPAAAVTEGPLVTICLPAYNAENTIDFAIESLLNQTYRRIEILVVDDKSSDATLDKAAAWADRDSRVRVLESESNLGAYVARNRALVEATGEFMLVHDADDWAHPQQVALQVSAMQELKGVHGVVVDRIRVTEAFEAKGFVNKSTPTLMVSVALARSMGGWHDMRIAADTEFLDRCWAAHGKGFLVTVAKGVPMSLALTGKGNLTGDGPRAVRYVRHVAGARSHYHDASRVWRRNLAAGPGNGYADPSHREFVVPRLMDPAAHPVDPNSEVDVVVVADLACAEAPAVGVDDEVAALVAAGKSVGLIHQPRFPEYILDDLRPSVWRLVDGSRVRLLTVGESVGAELLWVPDLRVGAFLTDELPGVTAQRALVGFSAAALAGGSAPQSVYTNVAVQIAAIEVAFGVNCVLVPRGRAAREALATSGPVPELVARLADYELPQRALPGFARGEPAFGDGIAVIDDHGACVVQPGGGRPRRFARRAQPVVVTSWEDVGLRIDLNAPSVRPPAVVIVRAQATGEQVQHALLDAARRGILVIAGRDAEPLLGDAYLCVESPADRLAEATRALREHVKREELCRKATGVAKANSGVAFAEALLRVSAAT